MPLETTEKDSSIGFKKLAIRSKGEDHCKTRSTIFSHFESKTLAAIDEIREKKRGPDIDAIYEHIIKSGASHADKNLIEKIIGELTIQNVIIINEICHGQNFFYKSSKFKQSIDFSIIKPSPSKRNNISNNKLTPQKQLSKSL